MCVHVFIVLVFTIKLSVLTAFPQVPRRIVTIFNLVKIPVVWDKNCDMDWIVL